jgi:hypothetical protein
MMAFGEIHGPTVNEGMMSPDRNCTSKVPKITNIIGMDPIQGLDIAFVPFAM